MDAAHNAYRRRFLLDKYPWLAGEEGAAVAVAGIDDDVDESISIVDQIREAGGPELAE